VIYGVPSSAKVVDRVGVLREAEKMREGQSFGTTAAGDDMLIISGGQLWGTSNNHLDN
jgi:hypothetical protein